MRSYKQFCATARALDVVGERWALLVVRELLLGPRRFTDLLAGLPGVGTKVLSSRLRELEAGGVLQRRRLPPPTPVTVYDLTADGQALRDVIDALTRWGARRLTTPTNDDAVAVRWLVTAIASVVPADTFEDGAPYAFWINDTPFTLGLRSGVVSAHHGAPDQPVAMLTGALADFFDVTKGHRPPASPIAVQGDQAAARQLIEAMTGCLT